MKDKLPNYQTFSDDDATYMQFQVDCYHLQQFSDKMKENMKHFNLETVYIRYIEDETKGDYIESFRVHLFEIIIPETPKKYNPTDEVVEPFDWKIDGDLSIASLLPKMCITKLGDKVIPMTLNTNLPELYFKTHLQKHILEKYELDFGLKDKPYAQQMKKQKL